VREGRTSLYGKIKIIWLAKLIVLVIFISLNKSHFMFVSERVWPTKDTGLPN